MTSLPVIIDISSDDESVPDEIGGIEDLGWTEPKSKDEDWSLKLLEVADKHSGDSDEVVVIAEFNPTKKISKSKSCKKTPKGSDDDCVILDGDPDNSVTSLNDSADGSDEILIVAEKGQIACRDYPHPRHLCALFPFTSTPHVKHCDLCHCYVCDTIAPCPFWNGGFSLVKHCHATDKEPMWKEQRISFRKENQGSNLIALPQVNQRLHHDPIQMTKNSRAGSCFSLTNQVSQSTKFQHCSSNNFAASTTIRNHGVQQLSASSENMFQLRQASHHQLRVENPSIPRAFRKLTQRDKGNSFSSLPSKFVTSSSMFKRTGALGGVAQFNRFPSYRNNSTNTSQYVSNPPSVAHLSTMSFSGDTSGCHDSQHPGSYSENAASSACPSLAETAGHSIPPINGSQISQQHTNQSDNSNWSSVQPEDPIQSANNNIYQQGNPNQICQQEISCEFRNHNSFQHGSQIKDTSDAAPDLSFDWSSDYSFNNQPSFSGRSQIIVSESRQARLDSDLTGNSHAPVNVERDNCFMENQSVPPEQDWLCGLNILSPPPSSLDEGMIVFDFETSWNGIAEL